jgi:tetratricopeptide (TPR) repeat protein
MQNPYRTHVFVSYSQLDQDWLDKLRAVFAADIRNDRINYWDDREIKPGDPWYEEIGKAIDHARVALLLVSPNFLASRFIMEEEVPRILKAVDDGLTVIWIPLFGTFYGPDAPAALKPLSGFQAAVPSATPLASLPTESLQATLLDLCHRIQRVLEPAGNARHPPFRSNLPFGSLGSLFKGRDADLARLNGQLRNSGSAAILQPETFTGMGGIGKTRLALEYAWRHANDFSAFLFVSANTPNDLASNFARLSEPLDLTECRFGKQAEQEAAVLRWLQQNKNWLLILDNVDTIEAVRAVKDLVSKLHGGQVLITSRITGAKWGNAVRQAPIEVMPCEDAVAFLLESTAGQRPERPDDVRQARLLAEKLGCLPLALTHAAAYIRERYEALADYVGEFERSFARVIAWHDDDEIAYDPESKPMPGEAVRASTGRTVATTFFMSFDRLGPVEKALLRAASFLAPEPVPLEIFEQCQEETKALVTLWCEESGETLVQKPVRDSITELARYSLVSRSDGMFSVHRMEQLILRSRVSQDRMPQWHERIRDVLCKYAPDETAESPRTWSVWDVLRPHAEFLIAAFVSDERIPPHLDLMGSIGSLLYGKGLYAASLKMEEDALLAAKRSAGEESKVMADKLLSYGESLRVLERYDEALKAFQQSIAIREKLDGKDSLRVADALNYQGLAHDTLDQKKEAEDCYRKAIAIYDSRGEEAEKYDLAKVLSNLASLVFRPDNLVECEKLLLKAVELTADTGSQKIKPQGAIICRSKLANVLTAKGDIAGATRLFNEAIKMVDLFPEENPFREEFFEIYASFLRNAHKLSEAKSQFNSSISATRPQWGSDGFESVPERRIRNKLRIVEATAKLSTGAFVANDFSNLIQAITGELKNPPLKPWIPNMLKGLTVRDTEHLGFDFLIDIGSEDAPPDADQHTTRLLMEFFLSAMAVDEGNQWVASDGTIPSELKGTKLGIELFQQAQILGAFVSCALAEETPIGIAFVQTVGQTKLHSMADSCDIVVEVWVTLGKAKVYDGELVGDWARFGSVGVAHALVIEGELDVYWQWHVVAKHRVSYKPDNEFVALLDKAFESHIAPALQKSLKESELFARLRQISYCMILGTWFKQKYRHHPNVAKFLETGNPNQLTPTIQTISSLSNNHEEGVHVIDI